MKTIITRVPARQKGPGLEVLSRARTSRASSLALRLRWQPALGRSFYHRGIDERAQIEASGPSPVKEIMKGYDKVTDGEFREAAFVPELPVVLKAASPFTTPSVGPPPAIQRWFEPLRGDSSQSVKQVFSRKLLSLQHLIVPYELEFPQLSPMSGDIVVNFIDNLRSAAGPDPPALAAGVAQCLEAQLPPDFRTMSKRDEKRQVLRFHAPLALLNAGLNYNNDLTKRDQSGKGTLQKLYIAQASLDDLHPELLADVPTPRLVKNAGKGDIYASSLWMGLSETYTPLHRDPNPNFFVQLCSTKVVRLLPPADGNQLFNNVQRCLGKGFGNSRIRGTEMMTGPEAALTYKAIWEDNFWHRRPPDASSELETGLTTSRPKILEAALHPGDALFIPKGWWHSLKSEHKDGRLNCSVNWWFR